VTDFEGKRHRTNRNFVGCFVGDHVKFAIETKIMTGIMIGTGAMVASSIPMPSPTKRFAWITDDGERSYNIDKFIEVAKTVMKRREKYLDDATEVILRMLASE
jgi:hypothetical protein